MEILSIIIICLAIIFLVLYISANKKLKRIKEIKIEEFTEETARECERRKENKEREFQCFKEATEEKIQNLEKLLVDKERTLFEKEELLSEKEKRYNEVNQDLSIYKKKRIEDIDNTTEEYKQKELIKIKQALEQNKLNANSDFNNYVDGYIAKRGLMEAELETIKKELEVERSKRAAINKEILRQKKLQEQEDFYKIQLPEIEKSDIEILRATAPRLRHPEAINKIIWSNYYQKPLAELRKRLLPNGDYSGIYKLTRLKTGEIYIGQTTSIDKRFQDHVKSSLGVGTLASSQLHRTMAIDGPENFTFEILEKVEKDKLKERESYYIDFYDSKNYGLNTVRGKNEFK